MSIALSFKDVSCRFGDEDVVKNVSFDISDGEIVCLLGASGCGKTTSLRLAAGMEVPSAGEIFLNGRCVSTPTEVAPPEMRGIGFLFQDFALFPHLSVFDNVVFGIADQSRDDQKRRADMLLEAVGLSGFAEKFPATLSGGEQQRAALARAMAPKPRVVLMDEPFSNLDPQLRDQMRDLTLQLLNENDAAGLIVTHDAADALRMADRIAVQSAGEILQIDTPQVIYEAPNSLQVAAMFGAVNVMENPQGSGQLGVRPEAISLTGTDADMQFEAEVTGVRAFGADWLCSLRRADGLHWQALLRDTAPQIGANKFFVPQSRLMLFKT